ncbi:MAG TPA: nucleotidyltransferase family protein [Candidatus Aquilonibacter sp.]|nr:nucleotidyltransferase family protein [Candidatus Aquilonibacter sp.]
MKAVITAGAPIDGEFARLARTSLKALAPVRGKTMLERTIDALRGAGVRRIAVVGNGDVQRTVSDRVEKMIDDRASGSGNVLAALDAWAEDGEPLLYATCDMPYIRAEDIRTFLDRIPAHALAMPLTEIEDFRNRFPQAPPFGITLAGHTVVNGGIFHIPPGATQRIRSFATALFDARKAPWKMARIAGPALLVKFALKRLSIAELEARARDVLGIDVAAVRGAAPELAFDADLADEYRYAIEHE